MENNAASADKSSLFMDFARYFDLSLALTEAQRALVYQVRYRVYCEEFGYEPVETFANHQEIDGFDDQSVHCLVTHRDSGRPAGCVRLVMMDNDEPMPLELHSGGSMDHGFMQRFAGQRQTLCEISRLAVDGDFRRRRGEQETRFGTKDTLQFHTREKRTFPLIAVSLFLAAAAVAELMHRKHCFAIMEPFLPAILKRTGVAFQRVGADFEFRGIRAPYYADLDDLVRDAPDELRLCYDVVKAQFAEALWPAAGARNVALGANTALGAEAPAPLLPGFAPLPAALAR
ncbi:PEP-CTERM/exosortase system-associated acyltransferase [Kineobactrum salinum]|uniref:PEP-CTERM/exosortase system-associated acyltransferase n=1 Tax=Kineobactrum salinum TaxID=2708301 RepID=A0A6C0TY34_9GAMM|nr:PEP-CTERM/exosortase system-associated acyltransferase [Kineobactrum salinum]QIB64740.1 PEP-CTERM/exosortase system-associated acyltransferase [Kineobactrum salinum]